MPGEHTVLEEAGNSFQAHSRQPHARLTNTVRIFRDNDQGNVGSNDGPSPRRKLADQSYVQGPENVTCSVVRGSSRVQKKVSSALHLLNSLGMERNGLGQFIDEA